MRKTGLSRRSGGSSGRATDQRWYETITFGFNSQLQSSFQRQTQFVSINSDSTAETVEEEQESTARHTFNINMSTPSKLFGWLGLNQALTVREDWFDRETLHADSSLAVDENKGFFARHTFSYTSSANTKLYGFFQPQIGGIQALRHVVTPSLSFRYRPDFSSAFWGYYQTVEDESGESVKRDRFSGTPRGEIASMNFSIGNLFQLKWKQDDEEKKIDLFRMRISSGYNFAADSLKLSSINTSISSRPGRQLTLSANLVHSPYAYDYNTKREINTFRFEKYGGFGFEWLRLRSFNLNARFSFSSKSQSSHNSRSESQFRERLNEGFERFEEQNGAPDISVPWRASFSLRYSINKFNPSNTQKTAYLSIDNSEVQLTENWRISFRGQFDFQKKQLVSQYWSIYRDMHCWEASLNWSPIGAGKSFFLRINIKDPQLRDIKIEKRGGRSSVFGGAYGY